MLYAICYMLYAICYMLYAICYMLYAICYMLYAICYMLYAVCYIYIYANVSKYVNVVLESARVSVHCRHLNINSEGFIELLNGPQYVPGKVCRVSYLHTNVYV